MEDLKELWQRWWPFIAGGFLVVALLLIWVFSGGSSAPAIAAGKAYFTVDDGQTWFQDDFTRISPFDHNGKTAYRCYLFTADGGKTKIVGYLERYNDEARALMATPQKESRGPSPMDPKVLMTGIEVKRPGDAAWINRGDPQALSIVAPPSGKGELVPVE